MKTKEVGDGKRGKIYGRRLRRRFKQRGMMMVSRNSVIKRRRKDNGSSELRSERRKLSEK